MLLNLFRSQGLDVKSLAAKNCFLFLWCTGPLMDQAIAIGTAWGFTYKTVFIVWEKTDKSGNAVMGMGSYTRSSFEFMLVFTRGKPLQYKQTSKLKQGIRCERGKHSEKPDAARKLITAFAGNIPTIELFARKPYKNWAVWGNQLPST